MAPTSSTKSGSGPASRSGGETSSQSRKRKATDGDQSAVQQPPRKRVARLEPRTKRISQDVITTKWTALPTVAQQQIREILKSAVRPVVLSRRDERQRREAETVLDHAVRRLEKQLPRMPFPPKSRDMHFSLDKLLERNRTLEGGITPTLQAMDILKAEIVREEAALDEDRKALRRLERNARAEQAEASKQARKIHPLLEEPGGEGREDTAELINLHAPRRQDSVLTGETHAELHPLIDQFRSHLESMYANTEHLQGLDRVIVGAEAALGTLMPAGSNGGPP